MNFELEEIVPSFISLGFGFFQVKPTLPWSPLFSVMMLTFVIVTCSSSSGAV